MQESKSDTLGSIIKTKEEVEKDLPNNNEEIVQHTNISPSKTEMEKRVESTGSDSDTDEAPNEELFGDSMNQNKEPTPVKEEQKEGRNLRVHIISLIWIILPIKLF